MFLGPGRLYPGPSGWEQLIRESLPLGSGADPLGHELDRRPPEGVCISCKDSLNLHQLVILEFFSLFWLFPVPFPPTPKTSDQGLPPTARQLPSSRLTPPRPPPPGRVCVSV